MHEEALSVATTREHMNEKLAWARRSLARMRVAETQKEAVELQDHFWSFLHATQLIWFYFGRWTGNGGNAKAKMKVWESSLSPERRLTWTSLNELRSRDVHVQPVSAQQRSETAQLTMNGAALTVGGARLVITSVSYEVALNGEKTEVFRLCGDGLALLERFVGEFDSITSPPA